jgi:hypothetical protein
MLPKTKIWEGRTNVSECVSSGFDVEALFNDSSLKSSTHTLEKCFQVKRILKRLFDLSKS